MKTKSSSQSALASAATTVPHTRSSSSKKLSESALNSSSQEEFVETDDSRLDLTQYQKFLFQEARQEGQDNLTLHYLYSALSVDYILQPAIFRKAMKILAEHYSILNMHFHINEKIIDADPEARISSVPEDGHVEELRMIDHQHIPIIDKLQLVIQSWIGERVGFDKAFRILFVPREETTIIVGVACKALFDMPSIMFALREALKLYEVILDIAANENIPAESVVPPYKIKEDQAAFITYSAGFPKLNETSYKHWRSKYIEYTHEVVPDKMRYRLEDREKESQHRIEKYKHDLQKLTHQQDQLEQSLAQQKQKRIDLEKLSHGPTTSFFDLASGKPFIISPEARHIFIKTFLQTEVSAITVRDILKKYEVAEEVVMRLEAACPTFESFLEHPAEISDNITRNSKEKRKITVAAEISRNYIIEAQHEHGKIKFNLERQIAKTHRELDACIAKIKAKQNDIFKIGEQLLFIQTQLNPPVVEHRVNPLTYHGTPPSSVDSLTSLHESVSFTLSEKAMGLIDSYYKKAFGAFSIHKEHELRELDVDEAKYEEYGMAAICLSACSILMKYISGQSKFLVGHVTNMRTKTMKLGPLSPVVPIKINLVDANKTFDQFIHELHRELCSNLPHTHNFPYEKYQKEECPDHFDFMFEYLSPKVANLFEDDIKSELAAIGDTSEFYALKTTAYHTKDGIKITLRYRTDIIDTEHVSKWTDKLLTTFESIDYEQKNLTVPSFITRFYNTIWLSKSQLSLEKISERKSLSSLSALYLPEHH